jgi:hypothetical protein
LKENSKELHARWETEKSAITELQSTKEQIEQTRTEIERAERANDLKARSASSNCKAPMRCSRKKWTLKRLPPSLRAGRASLFRGCWKARLKS